MLFRSIESLTGLKMKWSYSSRNREGDHICYISNLEKMRSHYPGWGITQNLDTIIADLVDGWKRRQGH